LEEVPKAMNNPNLEQAVKSLKSLRIGMTDAARHHLALECSEATPSRLRSLLDSLAGASPFRLPAAAGAMAIFLACGLALLLVGHQNQNSPSGYGQTDVHLVKVVPASSGGVTLEWKDGPQRTYTVLKSTDPRNFQRAETYAVRGNRWTDDSPSLGQVVYYKVE
jgi:hypothetical protein